MKQGDGCGEPVNADVTIPLVMLGAASMAIGLMPILPKGFHRSAALITAAVGVVWTVLFWVVWTVLFWIVAAIIDFEGWDVINGIGGLVAVRCRCAGRSARNPPRQYGRRTVRQAAS